MTFKVRFVYEAATGRSELQVIDLGDQDAGAEHDARHDRIAHQVGSQVQVRPEVVEDVPGGLRPDTPVVPNAPDAEESVRRGDRLGE